MQKYNFSAVLFQNVNMASKIGRIRCSFRADMMYILFLKEVLKNGFELIMPLAAWGINLYLKSNIVAI